MQISGDKARKTGESVVSLESYWPGVSAPIRRPLAQPSGGCRLLPLLLKTFPTENRPALRGLEGNCRLLAALGASGSGFGLSRRLPGSRRTQNSDAFCLAGFTAFGFVFELLIVKKQLFACGENKISAAVDTLEYLVLEFHPLTPFPGCIPRAWESESLSVRAIAHRVVTHPPSNSYPWIRPTCGSRRPTAEEKQRCQNDDGA